METWHFQPRNSGVGKYGDKWPPTSTAVQDPKWLLTVFHLFRYARLRLRPLVALGIQQPQIVEADAGRAKASKKNESARGLDGCYMVPPGRRASACRLDFLPVKLARYG